MKLIVALLMVALGPLAILTYLNKTRNEETLTKNANQALSAAASQTATSIDVFLDTILDAVRVEARLPGLERYLSLSLKAREEGGEDELTAINTLHGLKRKDTINIFSYGLLDLQGKNRLDTVQANVDKDESSADHFRGAIKTELPYVSSITFSADGVPRISFSNIVRDPRDRKKAIGVLRCTYNASALQRIVLLKNKVAGNGSFAILMDEHHVRLAHGYSPDLTFKSLAPLDSALLKQIQAERRLPEGPAAELETNLQDFDRKLLAFEKDPGSDATRFLTTRMDETGGEPDAVALARVSRLTNDEAKWTVAFIQPESVFLAPMAEQTRTALLLALLIAGAVTAVAILLAQVLTKPIIVLEQAASQLAAGNLNTTVELQSSDEIGKLARSFNQMARQLKESFSTLEKTNQDLEDRVEQRTAELKDAKIAADNANKAKSDFLARMSHELRTPLNGVLGYAQILLRSRKLSEEEQRQIEVIFQCGSHLLTLINDVLDLAKIEAQTMELHVSDFHFASFLRSTVEICRIRAEQKGIPFVYKPSPNLPVGVHADQRRLRQVLINLLGNAIKFTEKGSVTLSVTLLESGGEEARGGYPEIAMEQPRPSRSHLVRFEIEDTGIGIQRDHLEQIFLPFKQVGDGSRRAEGTGLGLAISQKIMGMMGSSIQVKSEIGKGSVFFTDVKLTESSRWAPAATLAAQGGIVGYEGRRRKVMVVDDQWENRSVIVTMLSSIGFEVVEAANGQEGLDKALQGKFDLVISDLVMPVMDGWELIRQLRKEPSLAGLVIIASSASVFNMDQHKSLEAGADDFVPKPLQIEELLERIRERLTLTWIYEKNAAEGPPHEELDDAGEPSIRGDRDVVPPTTEELRALLEVTRKGLVNQIQKHLEKLELNDPKVGLFVKQLRHLLKDFRLEAMEELVARYIENPQNDRSMSDSDTATLGR